MWATVLKISVAEPSERMLMVTQDEVIDTLLETGERALGTIISIVIIVAITFIVLRILRSSVKRIAERILSTHQYQTRELQQKAQTLASVIESAGRAIILVLAAMTVLTNLGIEIGPLIASAGIAGIAIGLGAQTMIKDTINGFFILIENQYAVGDVVIVGGQSGTVEEVTLRRTVLRALDGSQIIIPNGEIREVSNQSKGWSRAVLDIETAYNVDDKQVLELLQDLVSNIQADPIIGADILEPPQVLGFSSISLTGVTFRILIKTLPLQQWKVERELRLRIRQMFLEHGIAMPVLTSATMTQV